MYPLILADFLNSIFNAVLHFREPFYFIWGLIPNSFKVNWDETIWLLKGIFQIDNILTISNSPKEFLNSYLSVVA